MPTRIADRKGIKHWYAQWLDNGDRVSKKCASRREALDYEAMMRKSVVAMDIRAKNVTLRTLFTCCVDADKARGLSQKSILEEEHVYGKFCAYIGENRRADSVTYGEIERFLGKISSAVSGSRANRFRVHLVKAYNWGVRAFGLPKDGRWEVKRFKYDEEPRYVPTEEEFQRVYSIASPQWRVMLLAYLHTACRKSELLELTWADVDFAGQRVRLYTSKRSGGRQADWVPMTAALAEALKAHQREAGAIGGYVFINNKTGTRYQSGSHIMRVLCRKAGVTNFGFHGIRHLSASKLADANLAVPVIQRVLRHRSPAVTGRYIHELRGVNEELDRAFG